MLQKLCNLFLRNRNRKLVGNFIALSLLEVINYLIPIILIPYVISIFGVDIFGKYMFAQTFILYFTILVDFGFNFYATKEISINRHNKDIVSKIFTGVMIIKLILLISSFIILVLVLFLFPKYLDDMNLYFILFLTVLGQFFFPTFVFQGYEKMKVMSIINIIPKFFCLVAIFIYVKNSSDLYFFTFLMSLGYLCSGLYGFFYILKTKTVYFTFISRSYLNEIFYKSKNVFIANSASMLYINSNTFFLGLVSSFEVVGIYAIAEKIVRVTRYIISPLTKTLFPYYSEKFSSQSYSKSVNDIFFLIRKVSPYLIIIVILLISFSDFIVSFLSHDKINDRTTLCIYIMSIVIILGTYNNIIGVLGFINLGLESDFRNLMLIIGVINIILISILGFFFKEIGGAVTFVMSEFLLFFLLNKILIRKSKIK